jgi:MoaA/NifB/PqqE/SkfB family radical SAM enzyme
LSRKYPEDKNCPYFDQGLYIGSMPAGDNLLAMCCWQEKQVVTDKKISWDHEILEQLREEAVYNIPRKCSKYCSLPGHIANERERSHLDDIWDASGKIKKLHLEQSLICNLTCISCSSRYSSAWNTWYRHFDPGADIVKLKKYPETSWEMLDLSQLSSVHFTGGEPLMNGDNEKLLEHLSSIGRLNEVGLTYSTNGTIRPRTRLLELWSQARWVRLFFSLDGTGSTFEYTRYPAIWNEVRDNIAWFRELLGPCILIEVNAIVGIHNLWNMPDFFRWWKKECQTGNQGDPSQIFVRSIEPVSVGGRCLSLQHLPKQFENAAVTVLESLGDLPGVDDVKANIASRPNMKWAEYFENLDSLRKTNWRDSLTGPITEIIEGKQID